MCTLYHKELWTTQRNFRSPNRRIVLNRLTSVYAACVFLALQAAMSSEISPQYDGLLSKYINTDSVDTRCPSDVHSALQSTRSNSFFWFISSSSGFASYVRRDDTDVLGIAITNDVGVAGAKSSFMYIDPPPAGLPDRKSYVRRGSAFSAVNDAGISFLELFGTHLTSWQASDLQYFDTVRVMGLPSQSLQICQGFRLPPNLEVLAVRNCHIGLKLFSSS